MIEEISQRPKVYYDNNIARSLCLHLVNPADGRITFRGMKYFAYQIIAHKKFKRGTMETIRSSKRRDDKTISHICGSGICINPDHIVIEEKWIND